MPSFYHLQPSEYTMKNTNPLARYTPNHEWAKKDGPFFIIGITDFAQACCKTIEQAHLPQTGQCFKKGEICCTLESAKAATDVEIPLSGTVIQSNQEVIKIPSLINTDCYGKGWLIIIAPSDLREWDSLMSAEKYKKEIGAFFNKRTE